MLTKSNPDCHCGSGIQIRYGSFPHPTHVKSTIHVDKSARVFVQRNDRQKKDRLALAKPKSSICQQHNIPAHAKERILIRLQRPYITLHKRALLGQEMVEIGARQLKSAPESKLSYLADQSFDVYVVDRGLHNPARLPFLPEEIASSKRDLT